MTGGTGVNGENMKHILDNVMKKQQDDQVEEMVQIKNNALDKVMDILNKELEQITEESL
jgi:hypothetical protein